MPKGHAERYTVRQNYRGKRGWSVVGATGVVHGTHSTRAAAIQQQSAIYASQARGKKSMHEIMEENDRIGDEDMMDDDMDKAYNTQQRRAMARRGDAMPDGSFPIANRSDLSNAIQSVGRASNYDAAKRHIMRRAKELNAEGMLPEEWTAKKSLSNIFKSLPSQAKRNNSIGKKQVSFDIFDKGL